jgi:hypothetical protein
MQQQQQQPQPSKSPLPSMQQVMQQVQQVQTSSSLSSQVEHAVMLHTMRLLQDAFDGKHGFRGVLKLVLVVGFDAIKSSLSAMMVRVFGGGELVDRFMAWAAALLRRALVAVGLCRPAGHVLPPVNPADAEAVCGTCVQFTPHESFWRLLLLSNDPGYSVSRRVEPGSRSLEQKDMGSLIVTEVWTNVVIRVRDGVFALVETPVVLAFVHDVGKVPVCNLTPDNNGDSWWRPDPCMRDVTMHGTSGNNVKMPAAGTWTTYLDLLPFPEFRDDVSIFLAKYGAHRMRSLNIRPDTVLYFDKSSFTTAENLGFRHATNIFFNALVPNLPLPDPGDTEWAFNEFYIMMSLVLGQPGNVKNACTSPAARTHSLFGVELQAKSFAGIFDKGVVNMTQIAASFRQSAETCTWLMRQLFSDFDKIVDPSVGTKAGTKAVAVRMAAGTDAGEWRAFVRDLCAPTALKDKNGGASIGVHLARIVEVVTTEQVPNPAYAVWRQENEDCNNGSSEKDGGSGCENTHKRDPPAPTLTERRVSREVRVERVNDIRKPMDTVYLRQDDRVTLMRSLELFRDRKELMSQLGLPHKLGVLLHGLVSVWVVCCVEK